MNIKFLFSTLTSLFTVAAISNAIAMPTKPAKKLKEIAPITNLAVFKNGIVSIERSITKPTFNDYFLSDDFKPIHGTLGFSPFGSVQLKKELRNIKTVSKSPFENIPALYLGKKVFVKVKSGEDPEYISGVVIDPFNQQKKDEDNKKQQFLIIQDNKNKNITEMIDVKDIISIRSYDGLNKFQKEERQVYTLKNSNPQVKNIKMRYLTNGFNWAPNYKYILGENNQLTIESNAIISNELEDIKEVNVELISGFPNIEYANVYNTLALNISLNNFLSSISSLDGSIAFTGSLCQNSMDFCEGDSNASPQKIVSNNKDLFYQKVGAISLKKDETLFMPLAKATTTYQDVVKWNIDNTRSYTGFYSSNHKFNEECWNAIIFKNPFKYPLTTGPVQFYKNDKFIGQSTTSWFNPEQEASLNVNKALTIVAKYYEDNQQESFQKFVKNSSFSKQQKTLTIYNRKYRKKKVNAKATVQNFRNKAVTMKITVDISGKLIEASETPKISLLREAITASNEANRLT